MLDTATPAEETWGDVFQDGSRLEQLLTPWRLLAFVVGAALLWLQAVKPFVDVDLYWHVRLGQEVLERRQVAGTGREWAYTFPGSDWVTTQWLAEVVLAAVHDAWGFSGIAALRVLVCTCFALALAHLLLRGRRTPWAPVVFATTLLIASTAFQERPLLASLLLTVWLARVCERELAQRVLPSAWWVLVVTALWANLHGQWVVVPGCLGLLALGRTLEWWIARPRGAFPVRSWGLTAVSAAAGMLTPVGPRLLLAPWEFRSATEQILEWRPTSLDAGDTVAFALMVGALVVCWARRGGPVPISELVLVLGLCVFAALAVRNVVPAAILLSPLVVRRLEAADPRQDRVDSRGEAVGLVAVAACAVLVALLAVGARFAATDHVPANVPVALAQQLAALPGEHRVVNDYNTGGALVYWAGASTKVAVDGRADRYGGSFLRRYQDMMHMRTGWESTFAELGPDTALLDRELPLHRELVRRGWAVLGVDGPYVLLQAPA